MKRMTLLLCLVAILHCSANAQTMDSATMMKNWQDFMTPGGMQKMLAKQDGVWNTDITLWTAPGQLPQKSSGSCTNKMVLNGLYQESVYTGSVMGMAFEGHSTVGFDNAKKIFVSSWIDNMGSGIMNMQGSWDGATKSITMKGTETDPMTGKDTEVREVMKIIDDNNQTMEMYGPGPDGKEMKTMEIKFTRKK